MVTPAQGRALRRKVEAYARSIRQQNSPTEKHRMKMFLQTMNELKKHEPGSEGYLTVLARAKAHLDAMKAHVEDDIKRLRKKLKKKR